LSPERRLELLHTLVTLAADTAAVREAIKDSQAARDALTLERFELRKALKQVERNAKAAASNGATALIKSAAAGSGAVKARGSNGGGAAAAAGARQQAAAVAAAAAAAAEQETAAKASRSRLGELEESLAEHSVRQAPHLGCDRQRNDFFCIAAPLASGAPKVAQLCVLCHEYSWVRLPPPPFS
jgi:hypothetical protein